MVTLVTPAVVLTQTLQPIAVEHDEDDQISVELLTEAYNAAVQVWLHTLFVKHL